VGTIQFVPELNHAAGRSDGTDVTGKTLTHHLLGLVLDDHAGEQSLDDAAFLVRHVADSLELQGQIVRRPAFGLVENQQGRGSDPAIGHF